MAETSVRRRLAALHAGLTILLTPFLLPILMSAAVFAVLPGASPGMSVGPIDLLASVADGAEEASTLAQLAGPSVLSVKIASAGLAILALTGALLRRPHPQKTARGWSLMTGWAILPFVLLTPFKEALQALSPGEPADPERMLDCIALIAVGALNLAGFWDRARRSVRRFGGASLIGPPSP